MNRRRGGRVQFPLSCVGSMRQAILRAGLRLAGAGAMDVRAGAGPTEETTPDAASAAGSGGDVETAALERSGGPCQGGGVLLCLAVASVRAHDGRDSRALGA